MKWAVNLYSSRLPEAVRHAHAVPDLGHGIPHAVRVHLAHPHAPVELEPVFPLLEVHRAGDGGAVVGDEGLEGAVEEEVILLGPPQPGSAVVVEAAKLEHVNTALEVQLVPERHEAAEGGRLGPAVPVHHQHGGVPGGAGQPHLKHHDTVRKVN